jgi:hypothetical protein
MSRIPFKRGYDESSDEESVESNPVISCSSSLEELHKNLVEEHDRYYLEANRGLYNLNSNANNDLDSNPGSIGDLYNGTGDDEFPYHRESYQERQQRLLNTFKSKEAKLREYYLCSIAGGFPGGEVTSVDLDRSVVIVQLIKRR